MKTKLSVVKIGGNVIENSVELEKFLQLFAQLEGYKILVHGGGKLATELANKLGVESKLVKGRRITDSKSIDIITMVYGGLTNKTIVAKLQARKCNAIGLSGADGNAIQANKRPVAAIDYGFVGDINRVNSNFIEFLLKQHLTPVFCALSHDGEGQILNTNADTIASEIAISMSSEYETTLYYCFEKKGVLFDVDNQDSVVKHINSKCYQELLDKKIIADGMFPKLENCYHALNHNVHKVCLGDIHMIKHEATLYTTVTL